MVPPFIGDPVYHIGINSFDDRLIETLLTAREETTDITRSGRVHDPRWWCERLLLAGDILSHHATLCLLSVPVGEEGNEPRSARAPGTQIAVSPE